MFSSEIIVDQIAAVCGIQITHFKIYTNEYRHPAVKISESKIEIYDEGIQARFHCIKSHGVHTMIYITYASHEIETIYQNALDVIINSVNKGEKVYTDTYIMKNMFASENKRQD